MCIEPQDDAPTCFRRSIIRRPKTERGVNKPPFSSTLAVSYPPKGRFSGFHGTLGGIGESTKRESGRGAVVRYSESVGIESVKARTDRGK